MADTTQTDQPNLYLITPTSFETEDFVPRLAAILDAEPVACLRLALVTEDEDIMARAADALREAAHARDVPLVLSGHAGLVERLGLDGVHLLDGPRNVRATRKGLGADAIVGAFCGALRHDGMTAGEAGADNIAFGPLGDSALAAGPRVDRDVFRMVVGDDRAAPWVAEGALDVELGSRASRRSPDFFAIGAEIWREEDALAALRRLLAPIR